MMRKVLSIIMTTIICISVITGCGSKAGGTAQSAGIKTEEKIESSDTESTAIDTADTEDSIDQIEAIGDVDVDKGLFDVTITIPKDFAGDTTQEELDETVKEKGYKSATLNSDGSITYVMTKSQHKKMMEDVTEKLNETLYEMVGSENYPNITDVTANSDFTSFKVTTKNEEPDMSESFAVLGFYMFGGMYAAFNGESVGNIHVEYINADTGEVISSSDSDDIGYDSD